MTKLILFAGVVVALIGVTAARPSVGGPVEGKPNFVIIMADDMGYGDMGCNEGSEYETPELDRLAAEGLRFTDFHSSGNVCSPTRAGLMTGRYQQRAGLPNVVYAPTNRREHYWGLQDVEVTFAEVLREGGYATGLMGKWHLGYTEEYNPVKHGFDEFRGYVSGNVDYVSHLDNTDRFDWYDGLELDDEEGYSTHLITGHSIEFIEEHKEGPFCLYVAHEAVHSPWQGPGDPAQRGPGGVGKVGKKEEERAFREMLREMDKGVGEIRAKLKELGIAENTLVMFFSDNGPDHGSAGPLRGKKGSNWEGGHRVPAVAWWPGTIEAGRTTGVLAITLDVMPTLLDLAEVSAPDWCVLDGVSLRSVFKGGRFVGDRKLFWNDKAMRDGKWKLMLDGKGAAADEMVALYDLSKDPGETKNLAAKFPERVEGMQKALAAWGEDVRAGATVQPDPPAGVKITEPEKGKRRK